MRFVCPKLPDRLVEYSLIGAISRRPFEAANKKDVFHRGQGMVHIFGSSLGSVVMLQT